MSLQVRNQTSGNLERVAGFADVDSILSANSANPISNKAVYNALQQKIEKTVNDLVEYYTKSDVYNKTEVRQLIGAINTLTIAVVSTLPTTDISATTIYFVGPKTGTNIYDEYVYVNNTWVKIGDTDIDLSAYVTSAQLTTALQDYYTKNAVDSLISNYYTKSEIVSNYYTKSEINTSLNNKQNRLVFDSTPTLNSDNPVTSNGIKTAIQQITQVIPTDASSSNKLVTTSGINNAFNAHKFTYQQFSNNTQIAVTGSGASGRTPKLLWTVPNIAIPTAGTYLVECWIQSLQRMSGPVNFYVGILDPTAGTNNGNPGLYNTIYAAGDYTVIRDFRILTFNSAPTTTNIYVGLDIMNNTQVTIQGKTLKVMRITD